MMGEDHLRKSILRVANLDSVNGRVVYDGLGYDVSLISSALESRCLEPYNGRAYLLRPSGVIDINSAWDFGSLLLKIVDPKKRALALITPDFLDQLGENGYHEVDKLRMPTSDRVFTAEELNSK